MQGITRDRAKRMVGAGWASLIDRFYEYAEDSAKHPDLRVLHIKEKFGGLRIYVSGADVFIHGLIEGIEDASVTLCEICGGPAALRSQAWVKTLCDQHAQEPKP